MSDTTGTNKKHWSRAEIAEKMNEYKQGYQRTPSQRQMAKELGISRTTVQHWLKIGHPVVVCDGHEPGSDVVIHLCPLCERHRGARAVLSAVAVQVAAHPLPAFILVRVDKLGGQRIPP